MSVSCLRSVFASDSARARTLPLLSFPSSLSYRPLPVLPTSSASTYSPRPVRTQLLDLICRAGIPPGPHLSTRVGAHRREAAGPAGSSQWGAQVVRVYWTMPRSIAASSGPLILRRYSSSFPSRSCHHGARSRHYLHAWRGEARRRSCRGHCFVAVQTRAWDLLNAVVTRATRRACFGMARCRPPPQWNVTSSAAGVGDEKGERGKKRAFRQVLPKRHLKFWLMF